MASKDRDFLLDLYEWVGAKANLRNWDTEADIWDWEGVVVNDEGRVVELHLANKNFQGILLVGPTRNRTCLLYTSPSPRDLSTSRMPSSA